MHGPVVITCSPAQVKTVFNTGRKPPPPGAIAPTRPIKRWKNVIEPAHQRRLPAGRFPCSVSASCPRLGTLPRRSGGPSGRSLSTTESMNSSPIHAKARFERNNEIEYLPGVLESNFLSGRNPPRIVSVSSRHLGAPIGYGAAGEHDHWARGESGHLLR
jgi:hypothetical protein